MAFSTRERVAGTVQGEIAQSDIEQELKPVVDFREDASCHDGVVLVELQMGEEVLQVRDGEVHQLGDGTSAQLHIARFGLETRPVTGRTGRLAAVTCEHDAVLYLVLVLLQHLEERVDADFVTVAVPEVVTLCLRQVVVGSEDGESCFFGSLGHKSVTIFRLTEIYIISYNKDVLK